MSPLRVWLIGFGTVGVRYSQLGFGKTSSTTPHAQTPRNLLGFKDGTDNIAGSDVAALNQHVFVQPGDGASDSAFVLDVLPGITGLWQVEARQDPSFDSYISLDTAYVENWSLMLDLRIMARTVGVVFAGTGV